MANTSSRLPGLTEPWLTTVLFANVTSTSLSSLLIPLHHWPPCYLSHSVDTFPPQGLYTCCSLCLECSSSRNPHGLPLFLFARMYLLSGASLNHPTSKYKSHQSGPPCLTPCLVDFSPESSDLLYHLLIYFVIYLLSSTEQGFLSAWLTSVSPAR